MLRIFFEYFPSTGLKHSHFKKSCIESNKYVKDKENWREDGENNWCFRENIVIKCELNGDENYEENSNNSQDYVPNPFRVALRSDYLDFAQNKFSSINQGNDDFRFEDSAFY
jgi:hypothetical protein